MHTVFLSLSIYSFLIIIPKHFVSGKHDLFNDLLTQWETRLTYPHLGEKFILNKNLGSLEKKSLLNSLGVLHLLAISSGQIKPWIEFIISLFLRIILLILKPFKISHSLSIHMIFHFMKSFCYLGLSVFFYTIYGKTGALLRLLIMDALMGISFFKGLSFLCYIYFPFVSLSCLKRVLGLLCILLFWGNPFEDLSFILSSYGAILCVLSHKWMYFTFQKNLPLLSSLIASLAMAIPWKQDFMPVILAQILLTPYVAWMITPLSIGLLSPLGDFLIPIYDYSLQGFIYISEFCGLWVENPQNIPLWFMPSSQKILPWGLICLWVGDDYLWQRRVRTPKESHKNPCAFSISKPYSEISF